MLLLQNNLIIGSKKSQRRDHVNCASHISVIANLAYKSGNSAKLNSLLTPPALGTRHILKVLPVLILIGAAKFVAYNGIGVAKWIGIE
jgi:hypothetical protein